VETVSTPETTAVGGTTWHTGLARLLEQSGVPCEIELPGGRRLRIGSGVPKFRVVVHSSDAVRRLDELSLSQAYIDGHIDVEGDLFSLMSLRQVLEDRLGALAAARLLWELFFLPWTLVNRRATQHHYTMGDDFYLCFTDRNYHFYSHGIFHDENETLEQASEHKLEQMFEGLQLKPGMRLLDIGSGWGSVIQYCSPRGVETTSLTIVEDSQRFIQKQKRELGLKGDVLLEDFLAHEPAEPYDAIVIYGVIEHIPAYRKFAEQVWRCLKPGGRIYLDASATREKWDASAFTHHFTWRGAHSFLCLQDLIQEFLFAGLDIVRVQEETRDYGLTMRHWAERFDAQHSMVAARWGEQVYRAHRLFLWGGSHGFATGRMQAYHLVARRTAERGPRPGVVSRTKQFVKSLF
jgi:cyclopropane-fatty-acyl-phospholipid synthase